MKKKLSFLLPLLLITSCKTEVSKTPYEWCFDEILSNYDWQQKTDIDLWYSYEEIITPNYNSTEWYYSIEKRIKSTFDYKMTIYDGYDDKVDVYWGGIAFSSKKKTKYKYSEIVMVDCDWLYSIPIEKVLMGEEL